MTESRYRYMDCVVVENTVACDVCGSGLTRRAIVAGIDGGLVHIGIECAGRVGCTPTTSAQRRALAARDLRVMLREELRAAVEYRNARLADIGVSLEQALTLTDLLATSDEGGTAWDGAFLRRVVDHHFPP